MAREKPNGGLNPAGAPSRREAPARRFLGALALLLGIVAASSGVGIALPRLPHGVSASMVLAVVVTLAGLGLVVGGARVLLRGLRWWWTVPGSGVVLGLLAAGLIVIAQAVAATHPPATALGVDSPAVRGLPAADVSFRTADDVTLAGWWLPPRNGAAVVLLHGAGSTRSTVLDEAAVLHAHGYGVLAYDARGHGGSGGVAMDFGWFGDADLAAAVDFAASQPGVGRVGAVGMSMGAEQAIGAAAADERLRAVVAEGATVRVWGDKAWLSDVYGWRGAVQEGLERALTATTDLLTPARPPITLREAVGRAAPRPMLLITAGAVPDEQHAARFIQAGSPGTVTVWEVPGARHIGGLATAPAEWETRVISFLDAALLE